MRQTYENNKRRIQMFKLTADLKDDNGFVHHFVDGYEYIEIGGIKWATCNVGAEKETDSGLYFAWGETKGCTSNQVGIGCGKKIFTWDDYKFWSHRNFSKYSRNDGLDTLEACDDSAQAYWGGCWRMPSDNEYKTLLFRTTNKWTTVNGVNGRLFTDINDNSKTLFFPAVGQCYNGSILNVGSYCLYWSSSLFTSDVVYGRSLYSSCNGFYMYNIYRFLGFQVRAVFGQK